MKPKKKIIIMIIVVILVGLVGFGLWSLMGGQRAIWTTPTGEERGIAIPKIPGMNLVSEEKGECSYQANYLYEMVKDVDVSEYIKGPVKDTFLKEDWELKDERVENGFKVLDFYTEKAGTPEKMLIKIGFEAGQGTSFILKYQWPPCSEEE